MMAVHAVWALALAGLATACAGRGHRFPGERRAGTCGALGAALLVVHWIVAAFAPGLVAHAAWVVVVAIPAHLLLALGLLLLPGAPQGRDRLRMGLDGCAFALGTLCLLVLGGVATPAPGASLAASLETMAPFLLYAVLMGVLVYLASPGRYLGPLGALLATLVAITLIRIVWPSHFLAAAAIAVTAGVLARSGPITAQHRGERLAVLASLVPMLPALVLLVVLLVRHATGALDQDLRALWLIYPTLATILLRQVLALEAVRRLSASLEVQVAERSAALAVVQAQLERQQQLEGLGRLAGGVAHDFNNLLTAVSGYGHLVARRLPTDDPARARVEEIRAAVERGARLTRQILTFARRHPGPPQRVVPAQVVAEMASLLDRVAGEVAVELAPDAAELHVSIDPSQLEQLIVALATNARDAMPGGGRVRLGVGLREMAAGDPAAGDAAPGRYVAIWCAGEGVGLGLASSDDVVRGAGGFVTVEPEPGTGTRVVAHLPVAYLRLSHPQGEP